MNGKELYARYLDIYLGKAQAADADEERYARFAIGLTHGFVGYCCYPADYIADELERAAAAGKYLALRSVPDVTDGQELALVDTVDEAVNW